MHEDKTPEAIKADIKSNLKTDIDKREGSFTDDMAGPVALELNKFYTSLNAARRIVWVDETSDIYLDEAAADLGMPPRKAGTKAKVILEISGTAGYTIAKGTDFLTIDNLYYSTLSAVFCPLKKSENSRNV